MYDIKKKWVSRNLASRPFNLRCAPDEVLQFMNAKGEADLLYFNEPPPEFRLGKDIKNIEKK